MSKRLEVCGKVGGNQKCRVVPKIRGRVERLGRAEKRGCVER